MNLLMTWILVFFCSLVSARFFLSHPLCSSPLEPHLNSDTFPFDPPVRYAKGVYPYSVFCAVLFKVMYLDLAMENKDIRFPY